MSNSPNVQETFFLSSPHDTSTWVNGGFSCANLGVQQIGPQQWNAKLQGSRSESSAKRGQRPTAPDMSSLKDALVKRERDEWIKALQKDFEALQDHKTF